MSDNSQRRSSRRIQYGDRDNSGNTGASYNSGTRTYDPRYEPSDNYTAPASSYDGRRYDDEQGRSSGVPSGYKDNRDDGATKDHSSSKSSRQQREPSHPNFERGVKAAAATVAGLILFKSLDDYFEGGSKKSSRDKRAEDEAARRERKRQDEEVANDLYYKKRERKKRDAEERRRERFGY